MIDISLKHILFFTSISFTIAYKEALVNHFNAVFIDNKKLIYFQMLKSTKQVLFNTYKLPIIAALFFHKWNQIDSWKEDSSLDQAPLYSPHFEIDK